MIAKTIKTWYGIRHIRFALACFGTARRVQKYYGPSTGEEWKAAYRGQYINEYDRNQRILDGLE